MGKVVNKPFWWTSIPSGLIGNIQDLGSTLDISNISFWDVRQKLGYPSGATISFATAFTSAGIKRWSAFRPYHNSYSGTMGWNYNSGAKTLDAPAPVGIYRLGDFGGYNHAAAAPSALATGAVNIASGASAGSVTVSLPEFHLNQISSSFTRIYAEVFNASNNSLIRTVYALLSSAVDQSITINNLLENVQSDTSIYVKVHVGGTGGILAALPGVSGTAPIQSNTVNITVQVAYTITLWDSTEANHIPELTDIVVNASSEHVWFDFKIFNDWNSTYVTSGSYSIRIKKTWQHQSAFTTVLTNVVLQAGDVSVNFPLPEGSLPVDSNYHVRFDNYSPY